jgi:hypothetical protein
MQNLPPTPQVPVPVRFVDPQNPIPVRLTNPFIVGFWAFFGAFVASLVFWVVIFLIFVFFGVGLAAFFHSTP